MRTWLLGLFAFLAPTVAAASERCVLDSRAGIEAADAEAATDFVCAEVEKHLSGGPWHVKLGKLGSQVVVTLEGTGVREQLVLSNIEEIPVAAPRLVDAIGQRRPVVETMDVTNVVGGETRVPKKRPSEAHGTLMPVVLVMPGLGTSGGARVGLSFGAGRWTFGTDTTLAGYSFTGVMNVFGNAFHSSYESDKDIVKNPGIGYAALAAGARFHFTDGDTTPFVGGGIALMYEGHSVATSSYYDREHAANFGGAAFGEIGLEIARTRQFGATIGARIDAPAYTITTTTVTPSGNGYATAQTAAYVPVMTFGVGLRL